MGTSPDHPADLDRLCAAPEPKAGELSRRGMLAGAVAAAAILPFGASLHAQAQDARLDMMAFLLLSAALTGVHVIMLAPEFDQPKDPKDPKAVLGADPGVDPIGIKDEYFKRINQVPHAATFRKLLDIAKSHPLSPTDIIAGVNAAPDTQFLARSIVLLWYLGSWYEPDDLRGSGTPPGKRQFIASKVVSATAYTQGLVWRIAQAHPMGYSNLQFGYWSREPHDPNNPPELITTTIP